jgi:hypothetical protein
VKAFVKMEIKIYGVAPQEGLYSMKLVREMQKENSNIQQRQ